jgi:hypothetical protein
MKKVSKMEKRRLNRATPRRAAMLILFRYVNIMSAQAWPGADSSSEGNTRAVSGMFRVGRFVQQGVENLVGRCVVVALARP